MHFDSDIRVSGSTWDLGHLDVPLSVSGGSARSKLEVEGGRVAAQSTKVDVH